MSADSAILLEVRALRADVQRLAARLDATAPTPWPDRLSTREAVLYVRLAYKRARFSARTLSKWRAAGRLTAITNPPRWLREEIDRCFAGVPATSEARGARRSAGSLSDRGVGTQAERKA
jgi:hypothetical protein